MIKTNKTNKATIIMIILILCAIIFVAYKYILGKNNIELDRDYASSNLNFVAPTPKEANEYAGVVVSDNDMAKNYYYDFMNKILENNAKVYENLEPTYRDLKFGNYGNFRKYMSNITDNFTKIQNVDSYLKYNDGKHDIYMITDSSGNYYYFVVDAVMVYRTYFDNYTTELK